MLWVVVAAPALVAFSVALLMRPGRRLVAIEAAGLGLAILGFFLAAYFSASRSYDVSGCSECRHVWGRWWDPTFVTVLAFIGSCMWIVGAVTGALLREVMRSLLLARRLARP